MEKQEKDTKIRRFYDDWHSDIFMSQFVQLEPMKMQKAIMMSVFINVLLIQTWESG